MIPFRWSTLSVWETRSRLTVVKVLHIFVSLSNFSFLKGRMKCEGNGLAETENLIDGEYIDDRPCLSCNLDTSSGQDQLLHPSSR